MNLPRIEERISAGEMQRRYHLVRGLMSQRGLALLLICGNSFLGARGYLRYLTNWAQGFSGEYFLFPLEGPPLFCSRHKIRAELMEKMFGLAARYPRELVPAEEPLAGVPLTFPDCVAQAVKEMGPKRIGLCGLATMTADFYLSLRNKLQDCQMEEASHLLDEARMVKSPEEIAWVRKSAALADLACDVFLSQLKPGNNESQAFAEVEYAVRKQGAEATYFMTASGKTPVPKFLDMAYENYEAGDLVFLNAEIAGPGGYFTQLVRTFSLGRPSPETIEGFAACLAAQQAGIEQLRPGTRAGQVYDAIATSLARSAFQMGLHPGHSQGLDIFEKPVIGPGDSTELEPGMVIILHPHLLLPTSGGIWLGDTFLVTEAGSCPLNQIPRELVVV